MPDEAVKQDPKAAKAAAEKDEAKAFADAVKPSKELDDGAGNTVTEGESVPAEPGHRVAAASDAFDPNAARRIAEGRGPGLQDSEAFQPAVWVQPSDVAAAGLVKLQREGKAPKDAPETRPEVKG